MNPWDIDSFNWTMLTPDSLVLEVGAYQGRWAKEICRKYNPRLYAFEPARWAYDICKAELADYPNAHVFNFGLGKVNDILPMGEYETDGCSFLKNSRVQGGVGAIREIVRVFERLKIERVDLMLMNIEGYEYVLLPYMIETGLLDKVDTLMVQFHDFAADIAAHERLIMSIEKTHKVLWDYGTTLKAWEKI